MDIETHSGGLWKAAVSGSMRTSCQHSVPSPAAGKKPVIKQEWNGCRDAFRRIVEGGRERQHEDKLPALSSFTGGR